MALRGIDILTISLRIHKLKTIKQLALLNKKCQKGIAGLKINPFSLKHLKIQDFDLFPVLSTLNLRTKDYYELDKINYIIDKRKQEGKILNININHTIQTNCDFYEIAKFPEEIFNDKNVTILNFNLKNTDFLRDRNGIKSSFFINKFPNLKVLKYYLVDSIENVNLKFDNIDDIKFKVFFYFNEFNKMIDFIKGNKYTDKEIKKDVYRHICLETKLTDFSYIDTSKITNDDKYINKITYRYIPTSLTKLNYIKLKYNINKINNENEVNYDLKPNVEFLSIRSCKKVNINYNREVFNNLKYLLIVDVNELTFNNEKEFKINDFKMSEIFISLNGNKIHINDNDFILYELYLK